MNLEDIGFYTLNNSRAGTTSVFSDLQRCELIITDKCNFKCPYCRGIEVEHSGDMSWEMAEFVVRSWGSHNLKNIRFSGGEPTMWKVKDSSGVTRGLADLVAVAKDVGIQRIAISTNGSLPTRIYDNLVSKGVNDFSISLDSCCAETGDKMAGDKKGAWERVVKNIQHLSKVTYVTVGVVFTPDNVEEFTKLVDFADGLGVSDIRILSSAQWNREFFDIKVDASLFVKHPILKYRMQHFSGGRHVRGIQDEDNHSCPLMLDDMVVLNGYHFPCVIYMREQGAPIGKVDTSLPHAQAMTKVRQDRLKWIEETDTHCDQICKKNCLDVCIDYNNKVRELQPNLLDVKHKKVFRIKQVD